MHLSSGNIKIVLIFSLLQQLSLKQQKHILKAQLVSDLRRCYDCFSAQIAPCLQLYDSLEEPSDLAKIVKAIALRLDRRHIYWLRLVHSNSRLLAKRSTTTGTALSAGSADDQLTVAKLQQQFLHSLQRPGRFQLCNLQNSTETPRFVAHFQRRGYSALTIWYYMTEYITPLLAHELWLLKLAVPRSYAACGLTYFQGYAGRTLAEFGQAALRLRLQMAQQLLQLALKLTYGFDNFRIYITDFTKDNFAYDEASQQLTIIDLDTVIIVDAAIALQKPSKYSHDAISGDSDIFNYDVSAFCAGQMIDANVYQACRLLNDFLLKDVTNEYEDLRVQLNACVLCLDEWCQLRFQCAYDLIKLFATMLDKQT